MKDLNNHITNEKVFDILSSISENVLIINSLIIRLLNKLSTVLQSNGSQNYARVLLLTISNILNKLNHKESTNDNLKKFVPRLLSLIFENVVFNESSVIYQDPIALEFTARSLKKIITEAGLSHHQDTLNNFYKVSVTGETTNDILSKTLVKPISILKSNFILFSLFTAVLGSVDKFVIFPISSRDFVDSLISVLDSETTLAERQATIQTLSLVVNKWFKSGNKEDKEYLEKIFVSLSSQVESKSTTLSQKLKSLELIAWINKSLLLKGDPLSDKYRSYLVSLLDNPDMSLLAPKCLAIAIADAPCFEQFKKAGPFGKSTTFNINVRPLYKQKFFDTLLPVLITKFKETKGDDKTYLTTLSLVLKHVNKEIVIPHLNEILPLILSSLSVDSNLTTNEHFGS
ncbi:unnamed protein product [Ambrosiozyma monospora]|uniref:Unnamed protein product n=1 Tax=Ambrosiozyma monospora TaxID=43982 RepID=A0ACB5T6Q6_AMBMO|nr:unnamed protein product [Ambrosiozyma monospora]